MATKRLIASDAENDDQPNEKRMRRTHSFASVIGEAMMARSFQSFASSFEPLLRRVVNEEVERVIHKTMRTISRSPSQRIQAPQPTCLSLVFVNNQLPTIFTCNKILDINGEPLKVLLVEKIGEHMSPKILSQSLKLEIVVIDGDFPSNDGELWSVEEFNRNIIKERAGRRPLITKDVNYTMRNESCLTLGELEFTDNSSWIRSRKFKLGARVISQTSNDHGVRILEALTHAFIVKDQRGELYKKHYPPMLGDEVWRIEKIGKDGKFHKRLEQAGINTVQDFLKLSVVNLTQLKRILGGRSEISDRMWESVVKHARTCNIGNKLYYISNDGSSYTIILDAICNIVSINIDGHLYSPSDLITFPKVQKEVIDQVVKNAYENWDSLQEVESPITESFQHFQRNKEMESQASMIPYGIVVGGVIEEQNGGDFETNNNLPMHFEDWDASRQIFL